MDVGYDRLGPVDSTHSLWIGFGIPGVCAFHFDFCVWFGWVAFTFIDCCLFAVFTVVRT